VDPDDGFDQQYRIFQEAWDLVADAERDARARRRRAGWWKRVTVCWWRHRTRKLGDGLYVSHGCWACADG